MSVLLILFVYSVTIGIEYALSFLGTPAVIGFDIICIFFCLAGTTLIKEVRMVFEAVDRSLEEGRIQVVRIVGRDTSELSAQEVRTAALETLAENLSDGVIAPLFWYLLLGVPGMMAYKMVNTLDSMIGYHSDRYLLFGRVAARVDDVANYIPARLTAFLMVLASGRLKLLSFVKRYGREHASPNSGYPEAALAGILNCRFGGPHHYFGQLFTKPVSYTHLDVYKRQVYSNTDWQFTNLSISEPDGNSSRILSRTGKGGSRKRTGDYDELFPEDRGRDAE